MVLQPPLNLVTFFAGEDPNASIGILIPVLYLIFCKQQVQMFPKGAKLRIESILCVFATQQVFS